ncbi:hypothetical protein ACFVXC_27130 [Streptomyces sp. NPDC058257]|uniref:hypothetical protein n=1 Tax=Streptomyces sp. NPDC058257 TaxID=3346409 RepID=UPI0036E5BB45
MTTAESARRWVSARVRILLWLLFVMAVALAAVAAAKGRTKAQAAVVSGTQRPSSVR